MSSQYLDLAAFLRRLALRLRQCETPAGMLALDPKDQPYTNLELAELAERVAQDREDEALRALKMITQGAALTPQQMVETALNLANVETSADVAVNPTFLIGLAEIAQHAIEKQGRKQKALARYIETELVAESLRATA